MANPHFNALTLRPHLELCGYEGASRLASSYRVGGQTVPLAGFYGKPWDMRSACIAALDAPPAIDLHAFLKDFRTLGAPAALVCREERLEWWRIGAGESSIQTHVPASNLEGFFREHRSHLNPDAIHAAKRRIPQSGNMQLSFVDPGLCATVEREAGKALLEKIQNLIEQITDRLKPAALKARDADTTIYRTVFWLLAAKLLKEKRVKDFLRLDLRNVDEVFSGVARHYSGTDNLPPGGRAWRPAVEHAANSVAAWEQMGNISPEAIAYVYEEALVDNPDIRKRLGIHSTPPALVDYMIERMWPFIETIPVDQRHVFEPACGHAGFLVAIMRWLRDACGLTEGPARHRYLRDRLRGLEIDPFARELARLSLTIADAPHGNSWRIDEGDMFLPGILPDAAAKSMIILANPPYEAFGQQLKRHYAGSDAPITANTKAVEAVKRILPALPVGAVMGLVLPQGFLHDRESEPARRQLLEGFELAEINMFADTLFSNADHEVAVLIGRKTGKRPVSHAVHFRQAREDAAAGFHHARSFSWEQQVNQDRFAWDEHAAFRIAYPVEVWDYLNRSRSLLQDVAEIHKGFEIVSSRDLRGRRVTSPQARPGWIRAILHVKGGYNIWERPQIQYIDPDPMNFSSRPRRESGPKLIVNYARISRGPWRVAVCMDSEGLPVSSRLISIKPRSEYPGIFCLWAVLNSPVANAYAYSRSGKRETLVAEWKNFPLPRFTPERIAFIEDAARKYLAEAAGNQTRIMDDRENNAVRQALLQMDAAVLKAYDLPPRLERQLLDIFQPSLKPEGNQRLRNEFERKGVGCAFREGYYPPDLESYIPLHELVSPGYKRSAIGEFRRTQRPTTSPVVLSALRAAAEAYKEE